MRFYRQNPAFFLPDAKSSAANAALLNSSDQVGCFPCLPAQLGHGIVHRLDDDVDLLLADDQRRDEAQHIAGGVVDQNLGILEAQIYYRLAGGVLQLDAVDQTKAADLLNCIWMVLFDDLVGLLAEVFAHFGAVVQNALVEHHIQRRGGQRAGQRSTGEGGAVGAGRQDLGGLAPGTDGGDGYTGAQCLCHGATP